ncbi:MAG: UbiA prenyltransferase family protein [Phycisphaerales bacterium]|nr:UbiA prenyltransferase family protein [Phycisphaerales bacterium]
MPIDYFKLMRPADWVKNVFILPAIVFSIPALDAGARAAQLPGWLTATLLTIVGFSLLASGFYAINDSMDAELDRLHPRKRHRPIASGRISPKAGFRFGLVLVVLGVVVGFLVDPAVGGVLLAYLVLQFLYNGGLKRVAIVDAVVLATGFGMRATVGAFAIDRAVSTWLLGCVFFLTLYLAFIKRLCDLSAAESAGTGWSSPAGYENRLELNWLLGLSGVSVVMSWVLYGLSSHATSLFGGRAAGFALLTPLVLIVVHRFYRRANRGERDSPMAAMREDPVILVSLVLFAAGVLACLYVPGVEDGLSRLIFADRFDAPLESGGS